MHSHSKIRYVFISYEDLKEIKFKKLEKICDKIFILINEGINDLPFSLVQKIQKLGKNAKWIQISNMEDALGLSMAFLMGQMHEKINNDIEFAILSNDKQYDSIVSYLNSVGRDCIRVKNKKKNIASYSTTEAAEPSKGIEGIEIENEIEPKKATLHELSNELDHTEPIEPKVNISLGNTALDILANGSDAAQGVKIAANETIKRLIRSGNRPSELSLLKSYIILHNQNESIEENIEDIIDHLASTNEIEIREDEVIYNF
jgi:hypothetical protein